MQNHFSIIIPCFNGERFLEETIQSVLNQNYQYYELILIDDHSSDGTKRIIQNVCDRNIKVKGFFNNENKGLSRNINFGVSKAEGNLIVCLGQDDLLEKNYLNEMNAAFNDKSVTVSHCSAIVIDENNNELGEWVSSDKLSFVSANYKYESMKRNIFQSCGLCFRKNEFIKVGGWDEKFKLYGEWLIYYKIAREGRLIFANGPKAYYRRHQSNLSSSFNKLGGFYRQLSYYSHCRSYILKDADIIGAIKLIVFYFTYDCMNLMKIIFGYTK